MNASHCHQLLQSPHPVCPQPQGAVALNSPRASQDTPCHPLPELGLCWRRVPGAMAVTSFY